MTSPGQWIHIADHAWDRHGMGREYTIHKGTNPWVARGFSVSANGDAVIENEESTKTLESAKQLVQEWDSAGTSQHP